MATAGAPRSDRWLFGPLPDLLFGCGVLYAIAFAAHAFAGPAIRGVTPSYLLPLLLLLLSTPHYGGTLVRVYDQRRDRQAYVVFAVWVTLALFALFFASLHNALLASILFTLYLTWSPWHYTGQNYGIAVMFLRRRGVDLTPLAKRWLYAAFILSFAMTAIVSHLEVGSAYSPLEYSSQSVEFLPIGITRGIGDVVLPLLGIGYLVSLVVATVLLRRVASWRELAPTLALVLTQALWFSLPFSVHYWHWQTGLEPLDAQQQISNYLMMIFVGHGLQYLWITTYYARASGHWHGYANYWAKAAASGMAVWTLPAVLLDPSGLLSGPGRAGGLFEIIATFVNLHHFVLDGAIWKLRNTRIAGVLIRSAPEAEPDAAPRAPWLRRLAWSTAGLGLAAGAVGYFLTQLYIPSAIARGHLDRAEHGLVLARWLGNDQPGLRDLLVERYSEQRDLARASTHVERLVELRADGRTYAELGEVLAARGEAEAARAAFETAIDRKPPRPDRVYLALARLATERGEDAEAAKHYFTALRVRPSSAEIANDLAWLLATTADPAVRNVEVAVAAAEQLVEVDANARHLDTLAAAYAASGRFEDAVRTAARAAELAERSEDAAQLDEIRRNLDRYRARQTVSRPGEERTSLRLRAAADGTSALRDTP